MRKYVILFFFFFVFLYATFLFIPLYQMCTTMVSVENLAYISAEASLVDFQDETDMSSYSDGGLMSTSYSEYLAWLNTYAEYQEVVQTLKDGFSMNMTPFNFSIPYIDKEKLSDYASDEMRMQIDNYVLDNLNVIESCDLTVTNVEKEMHSLTAEGSMWGRNSSFYSNNLGIGTQLYDYDNFVTYKVTFHVDLTMKNTYNHFGITLPSKSTSFDFYRIYELVN